MPCRVAPEQLAAWRQAASEADETLSDFVRSSLDEAARRRADQAAEAREERASFAADPLARLDELLAQAQRR